MAGIGGHHSTHAATHDWITPQYVLDALGRFDLDPCASLTQPWPCATKAYTIRDNGLKQRWGKGRVKLKRYLAMRGWLVPNETRTEILVTLVKTIHRYRDKTPVRRSIGVPQEPTFTITAQLHQQITGILIHLIDAGQSHCQ